MKAQLTRKRIVAVVAAVAALAGAGVTLAQTVPGGDASSLNERLLLGPELPDFAQYVCPALITNANRWTADTAGAAALRRNGFLAGLREPLHSAALGADAVSVVMRFGSASGAHREMADELASVRGSSDHAAGFAIASIPDAGGLRLSVNGGDGYDILFNQGRLLYVVGVSFQASSATPVAKAQLVAAATALYERVR